MMPFVMYVRSRSTCPSMNRRFFLDTSARRYKPQHGLRAPALSGVMAVSMSAYCGG
jgi:hypothetical protein